MKPIALVVLLCLAHRPADACSCAREMPPIIYPGGDQVPIDAQVTVFVDDFYAPDGVNAIWLRVKGGKPVVVHRREVRAGGRTVIVLAPTVPLAPRTIYEVVVDRRGKKLYAEAFQTGTTKATGEMKWQDKAIDRVGFLRPIKNAGNCRGPAPFVELDLLADTTSPFGMRVGVWVGPKLDYTRPPLTYLMGVGTRISLGDHAMCGSANLDLPAGESIRFGFKLIDVAGNASEPREVVVDTTDPKEALR